MGLDHIKQQKNPTTKPHRHAIWERQIMHAYKLHEGPEDRTSKFSCG